MRITLRIVSSLVALTLGYLWTVGQTGMDVANKNLCELWNSTIASLQSCQFNAHLRFLWVLGFLASLVFLLSEAVSYAFRKRAARSVQDGKITRELADHKVSTKRLATSNTDGDVANNKLKRAVKNLKWSAERIMSAAASSRSTFQVGVHAHPPIIDDYAIVCAIVVKNIGSDSLERCTVRIDQYSGTPVAKMPFPPTLRTEGQVRGNLSGAVSLSAGQATTIPILFKRHQRANEWYFFDEFGKHYFVEANPMEIVISVYGGNKPEGFLLTIETDTGWHPIPSVRPVPDEFSLSFGAGFKRGLPDVAKRIGGAASSRITKTSYTGGTAHHTCRSARFS